MSYGIIYAVVCTINGKQYVGQTIQSLDSRWKAHISKRGTLPGFSKAIKKYGADAFTLRVLDTADTAEELNLKEQHWVRVLNTIAPAGYNLNEGGDAIRHVGYVSPETRAKMRAARLGKSLSQATKNKIRAALTGTTQPTEVVAKRTEVIREMWASRRDELSKKISLATTGKVRSDAVRAQMSEARKGIPMKESARQKKLGTKASPETREKMRLAQTGKAKSPESIEKSKLARTGLKRSEETKEKMRQAHRLRKAATQDPSVEVTNR